MLQNMLLVFVAQALFDNQRAHTPTQLLSHARTIREL